MTQSTGNNLQPSDDRSSVHELKQHRFDLENCENNTTDVDTNTDVVVLGVTLLYNRLLAQQIVTNHMRSGVAMALPDLLMLCTNVTLPGPVWHK